MSQRPLIITPSGKLSLSSALTSVTVGPASEDNHAITKAQAVQMILEALEGHTPNGGSNHWQLVPESVSILNDAVDAVIDKRTDGIDAQTLADEVLALIATVIFDKDETLPLTDAVSVKHDNAFRDGTAANISDSITAAVKSQPHTYSNTSIVETFKSTKYTPPTLQEQQEYEAASSGFLITIH